MILKKLTKISEKIREFNIYRRMRERLISRYLQQNVSLDDANMIFYLAALIHTLVCIVFTGAAYFWAGKTQYNLPFSENDPSQGRGIFHTIFQKWLFGYQTTHHWGKGFVKFDPRDPMRGYTDAFISRGANRIKFNRIHTFPYNLKTPFSGKTLAANTLALFTFLSLGGTFVFFPFLIWRYRCSMFFLAATTVLQFLFSTYWQSCYFEFWIVPAILNCMLFVLLLNLGYEFLAKIKLKVFSPLIYVILVIMIAIIGNHNFHEHVVPFSRKRFLEGGGGTPGRTAYFNSLFSGSIYKYPDDPYRTIYINKTDQE